MRHQVLLTLVALLAPAYSAWWPLRLPAWLSAGDMSANSTAKMGTLLATARYNPAGKRASRSASAKRQGRKGNERAEYARYASANCYAPDRGAAINLPFIETNNRSVEACIQQCNSEPQCDGFTILAAAYVAWSRKWLSKAATTRKLGCYLRAQINISMCSSDKGRYETFVRKPIHWRGV